MPYARLIDAPDYQSGAACYKRGEYFEAHEHWETLWLTLQGDQKLLVQGLIQIAAAWVKRHRNEPLGMRRLLESALKKIEPLPNTLWGVDVKTLREKASLCLEEALRWERGDDPVDPMFLPPIP